MEPTKHNEVGDLMYSAFVNIMDVLSKYRHEKKSDDSVGSITELRKDLQSFINRIDKTLIELYRLSQMQYEALLKLTKGSSLIACEPETVYNTGQKKNNTSRKRVKIPKALMREKLMDVASKLADNGKKASLTEISKISGIPYHKVVYACKNFQEFESLCKKNAR